MGTPHRVRAARAAAALVAVLLAGSAADARPGRPGSGYGIQGDENTTLGLKSVYSGIYGAQYTFDRNHYDFNACPPHSTAGSQYYTQPNCRR